MLFWISVAVMTAAAAAALLHPLLRGADGRENHRREQAAVYRDQLRELDRDRENGLISASEADNARAEIGRRLIAASREEPPAAGAAGSGHRLAKIFVVMVLPAVGLIVYLGNGRPDLPAQPLAARLNNPGEDLPILLLKAEQHLAANPDDGKGWDVLAPIYLNAGRFDDAQKAYRNAIRLLSPTPGRLDGLADSLVAAAQGNITPETRQVLDQSLALEPQNPRARFYLALALEQDGKTAEALAAFQALQKDSPPNAPWQSLLAEHVAKNGATQPPAAAAPGPGAAEIAAAEALNPADRQDMIRGMVESLDAKLRADPDNFEGWMRLIRSYAVLNDKERALDALKRGLAAFPASQDKGRQLLALAQSLGLAMGGSAQ